VSDPGEYSQKDRSRVIDLARTGLHAAIAGHRPKAAKVVQQISDEFGGDGVVVAIMAWLDTMLTNVPGMERHPGGKVNMVFREEKSGAVSRGIGQVPAGVAWASQMLSARATDDHDAFVKLVDELDDREFSANTWHLLQFAATNLRPVYEAAAQVKASRKKA
jgi:hypothetical protein